MKRGLGVVVAAALCAPATAGAQDLNRVTRGPGDGLNERFTEMVLSSADGRRAVFISEEDILGEGGEPHFNFYDRIGDVTTRLATFGGTGPRYFSPVYGASADASLVVFDSFGHWTADDTDAQEDVYAARGGALTRVSLGPTGGNAIDFDARAVGMSGDGSRILFESAENLTADDTDFRRGDIFLRENGTTTRVSPGNGPYHAELWGQSADASVLVFGTVEQLTPDDTDEWNDLYVRTGGTTTKLSPGSGEHNIGRWIEVTPDGRTVVFDTPERLTADDTDNRADVYRASGGTLTRVSTGLLGGNDSGFAVGTEPDGSIPSGWVIRVSDDGRRVVFVTWERLTADDTDIFADAYVWSPSGVERIPGHPVGASADGLTVVTVSRERLTADDMDDRTDRFVTRGGLTTKLTGDAPVDTPCWSIGSEYCGSFAYISEDGSRVFFETEEQLVAADVDDDHDVYQWAGGVTTLLSPSRPGVVADEDATFVDGALDGSIVYVETEERLTADDNNTRTDAYRVHPPPPGVVAPPAGIEPPAGSSLGAQPNGSSAAGTTSNAAVTVRLLARPRTLALARGRTRLARSGRGVRFALSRRAVVRVTLERLIRGARTRPMVVRLRATAGRHVLRLGWRLPGGRRLRPGRYRITLAATNTAHLTVRLSAP